MKNQALKCSQQVRNIPLGWYRLPKDGRKWRQAARSRSDLLVRLSTYANGDGTFVGENGRNYSPRAATLLKHVGHGSYYRLADDLRTLGLLSWVRDRHYDYRHYTIHLPETGPTFTPKQVPDSEKTGPTFASEDQYQVPHSPETGPTFVNNRSHSGPDPSLPSKEPSREREPSADEKPNPSPPHSNQSKSGGQDKSIRSEADVVSLVRDIHKATMKATGSKARFFTEDLKTLSQDLRDRPNITRDVLLKGVEDMNLGEMDKPQFAGREIATNLILTIESKSEVRAERLKKDAAEKNLINALIEKDRRRSDEEDRQIEERNSRPSPSEEDLFGTEENPK
jgi:hypothetical protein